MKMTDKQIASLYSEAMRVAGNCLSALPGLPDSGSVSDLANALLASGLVGSGKSSSSVDRAGADRDQDDLLAAAYGDKQSADEGNF
jgi:hypothetical protein